MATAVDEERDTSTCPHNADSYELISQVGKGATAMVFKGRCTAQEIVAQGEFVAVKIINFDESRFEVKQFQREISIMSKSKHPNIAKLHASFAERNRLWLILDYFPYGSVADALKASARRGVVGLQRLEPVMAAILYQTLLGLSYFHENNQMHRDVKAANLLLGKDGNIAMADFGVSAEAPQRRESINRKTFVGTPCWIAPEVITMRGYRRSADIWSMGITALELAFGSPPYANQPPMKVMALTLRHDPPSPDKLVPNNVLSQAFKNFTYLTLKKNPSERPGSTELLRHPLFAGLDCREKAAAVVAKGLDAIRVPPLQENPIPDDVWDEDPAKQEDAPEWDFPSMGYIEIPEPAFSPTQPGSGSGARAAGFVPKVTPAGEVVALHEGQVDPNLYPDGKQVLDDTAVETCLSIQHEGLLSCNEAWETGSDRIYWATASKSEGLLADTLKKGPLREGLVRRCGAMLADGIRTLHELGQAHRRISDCSVYHGADGYLKLDCVLSILFTTNTPPGVTVTDPAKRGSENYLAPEQYEESFDRRVDVYSFGLLLGHMLTGTPPYEETRNPMKVMQQKQRGTPPASIANTPAVFQDLIKRCLEPDPGARITIDEVVAHAAWTT